MHNSDVVATESLLMNARMVVDDLQSSLEEKLDFADLFPIHARGLFNLLKQTTRLK
jgi:hypothetical protein